jgi:GR25 family glycosyltransferase involved in LPS biosynthesis
MLKTPVLFLIFNRPVLTEQVFAAIKKAKPTQLFVAADGYRANKDNENDLCEKTRSLVLNNIDWDCEVHTLLREKNLGCKMAVSSAITWFFNNVEEGIILEDDVLPDESFFPFCEELLEKYRVDERVMLVSGANLLEDWQSDKCSYFSGHIGIWGWASWRRAWKLYDQEMRNWSDDGVQHSLKNAIGSDDLFEYFKGMLAYAHSGAFDTWDVQWLYSVLFNRGVALNPSVNMIKNIGFGSDASHTVDENNQVTQLKSHSMKFPLISPATLMLNVPYMEKLAHYVIGPRSKRPSLLKRAILKIKN